MYFIMDKLIFEKCRLTNWKLIGSWLFATRIGNWLSCLVLILFYTMKVLYINILKLIKNFFEKLVIFGKTGWF